MPRRTGWLLCLLGGLLVACGEAAPKAPAPTSAPPSPELLLTRAEAAYDPSEKLSWLSQWMILEPPYRDHPQAAAVLETRMFLAAEVFEDQQLLRDFEVYEAIREGRIALGAGAKPAAGPAPSALAEALLRTVLTRLVGETSRKPPHPHRAGYMVERMAPLLARVDEQERAVLAGQLRWAGTYRLRGFDLPLPQPLTEQPRIVILAAAEQLHPLRVRAHCRRWAREHATTGLEILWIPFAAPTTPSVDWRGIAQEMSARVVDVRLDAAAREALGLTEGRMGVLVVDRVGRVLTRLRRESPDLRGLELFVQRAATR